jgi:hypothetical protein
VHLITVNALPFVIISLACIYRHGETDNDDDDDNHNNIM